METWYERMKERRLALRLSQADIKRAVGVSNFTVSNWEAGKIKPNGENLTRLCQLLVVSSEWLLYGKQPRKAVAETDSVDYNAGGDQLHAAPDPNDEPIHIPRFDTGGKMGNGGLVLQDQPGIIQSFDVSHEWARLNLKRTNDLSHLVIVTGFGDSMEPLFFPGDPLLVDTSIRDVLYDGTYFFRIGNDGFIKKLQRIPGNGIRAISINRDYEPWTILPSMDFEVFGLVIKAWRGKDL